MKYSVEFRPEAERDLAKLDKRVAQRIMSRISWLAEHLQETRIETLRGSRWKGLFKLRIGDFRVIYAINHPKKLISVHLIGHRREIYE